LAPWWSIFLDFKATEAMSGYRDPDDDDDFDEPPVPDDEDDAEEEEDAEVSSKRSEGRP